MLEDILIGSAGQLPALVIFVVYLLISGRDRAQSIERNHADWRAWMTEERAAHHRREQARADAQLQQMREIIVAITRLQDRMEHMTGIVLLIYGSLRPQDIEEINNMKDER